MIRIDARGEDCPIPVIKTKKALSAIEISGAVETLVDNKIAVQNLSKMAKELGFKHEFKELGKDSYQVIIEKAANANAHEPIRETSIDFEDCRIENTGMQRESVPRIVVISSETMGAGNDELGAALMKSFIYTLTELDTLPQEIIFYNGGVKHSVEGASSLKDLLTLQEQGVKIFSCGACLNYYELTDKLAVGEITNMYAIAQKLFCGAQIVRP